MDKPQRKRIPLDPDKKAGTNGGDERAYTSNYGDKKPEGRSRSKDFDQNPDSFFPKKDGDSRSERPSKPYGARDFKGKNDGDRKPYSGRGEGASERGDRPFGERKSYGDREGRERKSFGDKKPYEKRDGREDRKPFSRNEDGEKRSFGDRKPFGDRKSFGDKKPYQKREGEERKSYGDRAGGERKSFGDRKPYGDKKSFTPREDRPYGERKPFGERKSFGDKKPFTPREGREDRPYGERKSYGDRKPFEKRDNDRRGDREFGDKSFSKPRRRSFGEDEKPQAKASESAEMTLNKYLAHSGISGRREAGELVKAGKVTVNKEVNTNPAYRVQPGDVVTYEGRVIKPEPAKTYVLLNKPKGFITTTDDEADRKTVMDLVQTVEAERLYPVGRLDRNTTGVLLITNDGDLAQRLTHPKYECKKIYQVTLDKDLTKADFEQIVSGVTLEDGEIKADALAYLETKSEIGIEIHSGRNRIVRRIFEHLGYQIEKLDRVMFAGLTKKNVPRGKYRLLTDKEVILLKHFKS